MKWLLLITALLILPTVALADEPSRSRGAPAPEPNIPYPVEGDTHPYPGCEGLEWHFTKGSDGLFRWVIRQSNTPAPPLPKGAAHPERVSPGGDVKPGQPASYPTSSPKPPSQGAYSAGLFDGSLVERIERRLNENTEEQRRLAGILDRIREGGIIGRITVDAPPIRPLHELAAIASAVSYAAVWLAIAYVVGKALDFAKVFIGGRAATVLLLLTLSASPLLANDIPPPPATEIWIATIPGCGPCELMKREVAADKFLAPRTRFIARTNERAFPTVYVVRTGEKPQALFRRAGYMSAAELKREYERVKK
jgi:hypothetical protein